MQFCGSERRSIPDAKRTKEPITIRLISSFEPNVLRQLLTGRKSASWHRNASVCPNLAGALIGDDEFAIIREAELPGSQLRRFPVVGGKPNQVRSNQLESFSSRLASRFVNQFGSVPKLNSFRRVIRRLPASSKQSPNLQCQDNFSVRCIPTEGPPAEGAEKEEPLGKIGMTGLPRELHEQSLALLRALTLHGTSLQQASRFQNFTFDLYSSG
jgi:hypothetical protein